MSKSAKEFIKEQVEANMAAKQAIIDRTIAFHKEVCDDPNGECQHPFVLTILNQIEQETEKAILALIPSNKQAYLN